MIIERATVSFEGLDVSPERAQAITERALRLVAETHERESLGEGRIGTLSLPPLKISPHALDDLELARALANAVGDALRLRGGGR
ncbi:MAG: hypothetical protein JXB05_01015 [Myxococcaceae bacterium]|nr:hypothetical protein [Myxococcaceae bacterium]